MPKQGKVGERWCATAGLCLPLLTIPKLYILTKKEAIRSTGLKKLFLNLLYSRNHIENKAVNHKSWVIEFFLVKIGLWVWGCFLQVENVKRAGKWGEHNYL